jgi:phosphatidylserine/phosphatidylglycerophosphate/cardiolipin synthase-like enzyme
MKLYYLLSKDCLIIVEPSKKFERTKIKLIEKPEIELIGDRLREEYPKILISLPPYNMFGLETELRRLDFPVNTLKEEFQKLFEKANHTIYICSPFLEYNGFDTYLPPLLSKAKDGVDIKIIARQISNTDPGSRYEQIKRIQKIFGEKNVPISIRNYHFFKGGIVSSTHAKMIVRDYEYAYVGSGELRRNSFDKNFEVGVILKGEKAFQLGKIFDKLFSVSVNMFVKEE